MQFYNLEAECGIVLRSFFCCIGKNTLHQYWVNIMHPISAEAYVLQKVGAGHMFTFLMSNNHDNKWSNLFETIYKRLPLSQDTLHAS